MKGSASLPRLSAQASYGIKTEQQKGDRLPALHHGGSQYFHRPFEVAYRHLARQHNLRRLQALFIEADTDRSGSMSLDEFREALRKTHIQKSFSILGVQPHQAEVIFKSMDKEQTGELSIQDFMTGLEELVGSDLDEAHMEIDVDTLRPAFKTKQQLVIQSVIAARNARGGAGVPDGWSPTEVEMKKLGQVGLSGAGLANWIARQKESATEAKNRDALLLADAGILYGAAKLPEETLHRAYAHTAAANALHPAIIQRKPSVRRRLC